MYVCMYVCMHAYKVCMHVCMYVCRNQKSYQPANPPASQPASQPTRQPTRQPASQPASQTGACVLIQRKPTFFIVPAGIPALRSPSNVVFCNKYSVILLFWLKKFVCTYVVAPSFYHHFFESCLGKTYIR